MVWLWCSRNGIIAQLKGAMRLYRSKNILCVFQVEQLRFKRIKAVVSKLQKCFQQWQYLGAKGIVAKVEHFEGDPSQKAVSIQVCLQ
jgi:hypothetical protein